MSRDGRKRAELRCMRSPEARGIGASSAASSRRVGLAGDVMALLPKAEAETTQSALTQKGTALEQKVDESQMALQAKSDEAATAKQSLEACPWNGLCQPMLPEVPMNADAYQFPQRAGAACILDLDINKMIRCHSILWEPDFLSEPVALGQAALMRGEVLLNDPPVPFLQSEYAATYRSFDPSRSILRQPLTCTGNKKVCFQPFAEVIEDSFPPLLQSHHDEPHSDSDHDLVWLMARQPRPQVPHDSPSDVPHDESATSPSSPSTFSTDQMWRSAQVYDLQASYQRGRIRPSPDETRFSDIRRLLGYGHHDVAEIFEVIPAPLDLSHIHVDPFILVRHDDILFGDNRRAVLIDIELHDHAVAAQIETDRYTRLLPTPTTRALVLRHLGVDRYCRTARDRCLLWHKGHLIPLQHLGYLHLDHGDYLRIALPPFACPEVGTFYAVRACQHGLSPLETVERHRINPNPDDLHTEVEAEQHEHDITDLMQITSQTSSTCHHSEDTVVSTNSSHEQCGASLFPLLHPAEPDAPAPQELPSWARTLHQFFEEHAETACEEEGPIAFLTTWFLTGSLQQKSEDSRVLRLDQHVHLWLHDLHELWRDRIESTSPVEVVMIHPQPPRHDTAWTIGHLIVFQNIHLPFVLSLVTIKFLADRRAALNQVATVLETPASGQDIHDLCGLSRFCEQRDCTLQKGSAQFQLQHQLEVHAGDGFVFNIFPIPESHHFGPQHEVTPQWRAHQPIAVPEDLEFLPDLQDESPFVQSLHDIWETSARQGPANLERLLQITSWCVRPDVLSPHDEAREVTLGEDFQRWEATLRRRWLVHLDPDGFVEFAIVHDPPGPASGHRVQVIVHQHLHDHQRAALISIYDNGVLNNLPYFTAAVVPHPLHCHSLLRAVHREADCPPHKPTTTCIAWMRGNEIGDQFGFPCRHGHHFHVNIYRHMMIQWEDEDDSIDPTAASSTNLLQTSVHRHPLDADSVSEVPPGRPTTETVAHAQWPRGTILSLADCIEEPATVNVDFSAVFHIEAEINGITNYIQQPWPAQVHAPEHVLHAFMNLCAINNEIPIGYHFFTDGSKNTEGNVGSAVILLIETASGLQYGGCLYKRIHCGHSAYAGENGAITGHFYGRSISATITGNSISK